ncbi:MAG: hypothetical protein WD771_10585 [Gemmatimonadaceae bacterium]
MPNVSQKPHRRLIAALFLGVIAVAPAGAQTPTRNEVDSLTMRLEDAEAMIQMLRTQLGTEAASTVRSRSRMTVELSGRVLMNVFQNSKETNNADVPMYRKQVPDGSPKGGMGMAIRQTTLGLAVSAPDVLGGHFLGDLDADFFGGQFLSPGGRTHPVLRIRTARAIVEWQQSQLLIGQEQPLIAGLNPVSLSAVGVPLFSYSGNLWLWLPQIRAGWHTEGRMRVGVQAAALAPTTGDTVGEFNTLVDQAERSGMPFLQARAHLSWGSDENAGEFGIGYHTGQIHDVNEDAHPSTAIAADFLVPFASRFELRGEFYSGQLLKGLGGGAIGQNFGVGGTTPVRAIGGWAQVNVRLTPRLLVGAGYGLDDPNDDDLDPTGTRFLNTTTEAHLHWRPAGPLVFGLEYRTIRTRYDASDYPNTHINLAFGFEF